MYPFCRRTSPTVPVLRGSTSGVAVISSGCLADYAGGRRVVVAPSNKRSASRTAQGRRMEAVVAQALCREPVHRWRRYAAAERTELAEACVVNQDEHDVRRTLGCLYRLRELRRVGIGISSSDVAGEVKVGSRQYARCVGGRKALVLALRQSRACY